PYNQEPDMERRSNIGLRLALMMALGWIASSAQQPSAPVPTQALKFGVFQVRFDPGGTFTLQGDRWPALSGKWSSNGGVIELTMSGGPGGCDGPGRYEYRVDEKTGASLSFKLISDECTVRRMIVDGSTWVPADQARTGPPRLILLTPAARLSSNTAPKKSQGSWPSFRGPEASGIAEK